MTRLLVTGATGFLGSHISRRMAADGAQVRVLIRRQSDQSRFAGVPVTSAVGDVTAAESLAPAVAGCDWVIHAAADLNYWRQDDARQMQVNVEGTRNIARACRRAGARLLHVSSVAAIGLPARPDEPAGENFVFNLQNSGLTYHLSKRYAEEAVQEEVRLGLDAVIVNPASITGPQRVSGLIHSVRRRALVPHFSGGVCAVHVADVVEGIRAAMERGRRGRRYILGGDNLSFRRMSEKAAERLGLVRRYMEIPPMFTGFAATLLEPWGRRFHRPPKFSHMIHYCANRFQYYDSTRARQELQYRPRSFDAILEEALSVGGSRLAACA